MNTKSISEQEEWHAVAKELEAENLKLASYDNTLLSLPGNIKNKKILDYGAGPGILALALKKLGAEVKVWDINPEMREKAAQKIGAENVYGSTEEIPQSFFDVIICNLVLCIVPENEVVNIVKNIGVFLNKDGSAYIGFCNPKIFQVPESNLDLRFPTGNTYEENHQYKKIKKGGGYEIIETHRPIEWYENVYRENSLETVNEFFTPEYELKGNKVKDFIIFEVRKNR